MVLAFDFLFILLSFIFFLFTLGLAVMSFIISSFGCSKNLSVLGGVVCLAFYFSLDTFFVSYSELVLYLLQRR